MFQRLNIDEHVWDCCSNGKNITFFAINDKCNKTKLSQTFNKFSDSKPGIIKMAIESVFAYIFHDSSSDFVIKIQYLEINNEKTFDLLNKGSPDTKTSLNCTSIDHLMELKNNAEQFRLFKFIPKGEDASSTLVFRIMVESISKKQMGEYTMMDKQCKMLQAQLTFVEISDTTDLHSVIR